MDNPKPKNVPKTIAAGLENSTRHPPPEDIHPDAIHPDAIHPDAIHRDAIRQHKLEIRPAPTTDLQARILKQLELLAQAKRFAESLGEDHLNQFAQALEVNIRPITAVVHNAVASVLGFPTITFEPAIAQTREPDARVEQMPKAEKPAAPAVDQAALKKRLQSLERANHDLRIESNILNNQMVAHIDARKLAESQCRTLSEERDDLKTLASELEQSRKSLKAELLEVRQNREALAVEIRQEQSTDRKPPPSLPENPTLNREPTPRPQGGQTAGNRVSPPTLTVGERQEIERLATTLMATLVRLEGHKIRSVDIGSVTGIATGWKRTVEHLIGLGQVVHHNEFLCISDVEKIRRGLK